MGARTIVGDLGGLSHIAWVTSAFLLAQTAVTPIYGKLGDLYGRKRSLQSAVTLFSCPLALRASVAAAGVALLAFDQVVRPQFGDHRGDALRWDGRRWPSAQSPRAGTC